MSLKIKLISCISIMMLMIGVLIIGVYAATQTINLKGSVDFNISDTTLYVKDIRLQTETTGAAETIENFIPGYTNTTFDLNLGTVTSSSGSVKVYFDFVNTTSTAYSATATGGSGVVLSTSGTINGEGVSIADVPTYGGISGTITLTIQLASGTSGDISLDGIMVTIEEYVPPVEISVYSNDEILGMPTGGGFVEIGQEVILTADFTGNSDADFLGWKTSLEAEDFVSTLPNYTFNLEESSPTTYYAIYEEPNEYLNYTYNTPVANEAELTSCSSGAKDIIVPSAIYRSSQSASYEVTSIYSSRSSSGGAFAQARSTLQSVSLPETITSISNYSFYGCSSLTSVTIPDSVTSIDLYAFAACHGLTSITIPKKVTTIGTYAFSSCSGLTSVIFEEDSQLITIWGYAFRSCSKLTSITFPADKTEIFANAFEGCSGLTSVTISGNLAIAEQGFSVCSNLTNVTILNTVTRIESSTFAGCDSLTSVTFEENSQLASIGASAFGGCSGLTSITIPEGVTTIGDSAFSGCSGLTSVTFGENSQLTSIGSSAFFLCSSLTSITIPESVTTIGDSAFSDCSGLTGITIPKGVTLIGRNPFVGCSGLETIVVEEGNSEYHIDGNCLIETNSKTLIAGCKNSIIPTDGSVTTIGNTAFSGCSGLIGVFEIPNSVTSVGDYAFALCSGLTSITLPSSLTTIGDSAFSGCTSLTSITIKATTPPTLGSSAIPSNVKNIYVPAASVKAYKSGWSSYASIIFAIA